MSHEVYLCLIALFFFSLFMFSEIISDDFLLCVVEVVSR